MDQESTKKVGSLVVALALLGMVGSSVAPSAQASEIASAGDDEEGGPCIKIYTDPPDATVDPRNCEVPPPPNGALPGPAS